MKIQDLLKIREILDAETLQLGFPTDTEMAIARGQIKCSNEALAAKIHSERTGYTIEASTAIIQNYR